MKLSPRTTLIAAAIGVLVIAALLVALFIVPQIGKMGDLQTQIDAANEETDAAEGVLERRQSMKDRAAATEAELLQLANGVPENPELPSLIIELQQAATDAGLQFRTLTPAPPEAPYEAEEAQPPAGYLRIPIDLEVFGTWPDTIDFMQRVDKMPRQLRITAVTSEYASELPPQAPQPPPTVPVLTSFSVEAYFIPAPGTPSVAPEQ